MKKCQFYSMMRTDNGPAAVIHDGYTDGTYYYYKNDVQWSAIHPETGLQVVYGYTRKECAEKAHAPQIPGAVARYLAERPELAQRFAEAVKKAKGAA